MSVSLDFLGRAAAGGWLNLRLVVLRHGRTPAFVECRPLASGRLIARGSATFRFI